MLNLNAALLATAGIGSVDGTLGSCSSTPSCLSSYDDRPSNFLAPWMYEARSATDAMRQLMEAVEQAGAETLELGEGGTYLYAGMFECVESTFIPTCSCHDS